MKGWKTVLVNGAIGIVGVLTTMFNSSPLDPVWVGMIGAGLGALNIYLRSITDTAIGQSS